MSPRHFTTHTPRIWGLRSSWAKLTQANPARPRFRQQANLFLFTENCCKMTACFLLVWDPTRSKSVCMSTQIKLTHLFSFTHLGNNTMPRDSATTSTEKPCIFRRRAGTKKLELLTRQICCSLFSGCESLWSSTTTSWIPQERWRASHVCAHDVCVYVCACARACAGGWSHPSVGLRLMRGCMKFLYVPTAATIVQFLTAIKFTWTGLIF